MTKCERYEGNIIKNQNESDIKNIINNIERNERLNVKQMIKNINKIIIRHNNIETKKEKIKSNNNISNNDEIRPNNNDIKQTVNKKKEEIMQNEIIKFYYSTYICRRLFSRLFNYLFI